VYTNVILLIDIDGTLILTGGAGRRGLALAFGELHGRPDACENIRFGGMTDHLILEAAFDYIGVAPTAAAKEALFVCYLRHLEAEVAASDYQIMPGAEAFVAAITGLPGVAVGLGTGNIERGARIKLARGKLGAPFDFGGFGSDATARADVIAAGIRRGAQRLEGTAIPAMIVGDTPKDVEAAHANGARCVAVATGGYTYKELWDSGADFVFETLESPGVLAATLDRAPDDGAELRALIDASPLLAGLHEVVLAGADHDPAHDMGHLYRVALWAGRLYAAGPRDATITDILAAALLHDIVNVPKSSPDRAKASLLCAARARELLTDAGVDGARLERICDAIRDHSFSRGATPNSELGKALQDADRLEALGAIGIARTFATSVRLQSVFIHPDDPWGQARELDDNAFAVDHFFTKLLTLHETFHTEPARAEGAIRARRLHDFLDWFGDEVGAPR
jgi:HD superfamily phosphodiesterase/phosphoglycolate phosphatase-like HAD superfamily hydrolase